MFYSVMKVRNRNFVAITNEGSILRNNQHEDVISLIGSLPELQECVWEYTDTSLPEKLAQAGYIEGEYPKGILEYMKSRGSFSKK